MILPDDMLVPITQDVDSLAPVHPALAGLGFPKKRNGGRSRLTSVGRRTNLGHSEAKTVI